MLRDFMITLIVVLFYIVLLLLAIALYKYSFWLGIGLNVIVVVLTILGIYKGIKIVPEKEVWIIERLGEFHRALGPGVNFIFPFLDKIKTITRIERKKDNRGNIINEIVKSIPAKIPFEKDIYIDIGPEVMTTKDNVKIILNTNIFIRILKNANLNEPGGIYANAVKAVYEVDDYYNGVIVATISTLRNIVSNLTLKDISDNKITIIEENGEKVQATIEEEFKNNIQKYIRDWGITVKTFDIKNLEPLNQEKDKKEQSAEETEKKIENNPPKDNSKKNIVLAKNNKINNIFVGFILISVYLVLIFLIIPALYRYSEWLGIGLSIIVVALTILGVYKGIKIVPEKEVWIIERLGEFQKALGPGMNFIIPFLDKIKTIKRIYREKDDSGKVLKETIKKIPAQIPFEKDISVDIDPVEMITKDNANIKIDTIIYIRIPENKDLKEPGGEYANAVRAAYEVDDYYNGVIEATITALRNVVGNQSLNDILDNNITIIDENGEKVKTTIEEKVKKSVQKYVKEWGITVKTFDIQKLEPSEEMRKAMDQQAASERAKQAAIQRAEAEKEAAVLAAKGKQEAAKLEAEAQIKLADAYAESMKKISEGLQGQDMPALFLLGSKYINALDNLGQSENAKLMIYPADLQNTMKGMLGGAFAGSAIGAIQQELAEDNKKSEENNTKEAPKDTIEPPKEKPNTPKKSDSDINLPTME